MVGFATPEMPSLRVEDDFSPIYTDNLLDVRPQFFVPRLPDRPQNPILDTLKKHRRVRDRRPVEKQETENTLPQDAAPSPLAQLPELGDIWKDLLSYPRPIQSEINSWDALRPTFPSGIVSSPFISEVSSETLSAVRYHLQIHSSESFAETIHVPATELVSCLHQMSIGSSSTLHQWDQESETFQSRKHGPDKSVVIMLDGWDAVITDSLMQRFQAVGTLVRRLEALVSSIRIKSQSDGSTIHAFSHAVSSVLVFLRDQIAKLFLSNDSNTDDFRSLLKLWTRLSIFEETLIDLATLCDRDLEKKPSQYPVFESDPVRLLSRIYDFLCRQFDRQSQKLPKALIAYLLTYTSRPYMRLVCESCAFGGLNKTDELGRGHSLRDRHLGELSEDEDALGIPEEIHELYPSFFPQKLASSLPNGRRSLALLKQAQPDHPLLTPRDQEALVWFWTDEAVRYAWESQKGPKPDISPLLGRRATIVGEKPLDSQTDSEPLAQFFKFNLEPGSHLSGSSWIIPAVKTLQQTGPVSQFLDAFPDTLPALTPTLAHLAELMLSPLSTHVDTLSDTLLKIFLAPDSRLNVYTHLKLMRSYLLLTSPSFKTRLNATLFSDSETPEVAPSITSMSGSANPKVRSSKKSKGRKAWAVGLAPALTERDTWPPGGADLSYHLRTVIVDSLEADEPVFSSEDGTIIRRPRSKIIEEAEFRLGFAIRDLPYGHGRDKWLNPLAIEALDFLYMDYKPPPPLGIVVTPEVLSKYQRAFAFVLRLLRAENAIYATYRIVRKGYKPLFSTLVSSQKLLLQFRFMAQAFITTLSSHVMDVVIRGTFDDFLVKLQPHGTENRGSLNTDEQRFHDVFALATHHSSVMDEILSGCLLRSSQRAIGDLLRGVVEHILTFAVFVGELSTGHLEEYRATSKLESLFTEFQAKMQSLINTLKATVDKGPAMEGLSMEQASLLRTIRMKNKTTAEEVLYQLLVRLDINRWWK